jgi:hypothetical protein
MARAFRPSIMVSVPRNYNGEFQNNISNGAIQKQFATYSEVKKRIKDLLKVSVDNEVSVYRHRRGEWGEWFEKWSLINGKPTIIKQGWQ